MAIIFLSADDLARADVGHVAHQKWNHRCQLMVNVYGEFLHASDDAYQNFWYGESKEVSIPAGYQLSEANLLSFKSWGVVYTGKQHIAEEILVVTRHSGMVDYLVYMGYVPSDAVVISHVTDSSVLKDKTVWGVLPHSLSSLCSVFCEVPLNLPSEYRGKELSMEEMFRFACPAKSYAVQVVAASF